jgi:hypothetical protein
MTTSRAMQIRQSLLRSGPIMREKREALHRRQSTGEFPMFGRDRLTYALATVPSVSLMPWEVERAALLVRATPMPRTVPLDNRSSRRYNSPQYQAPRAFAWPAGWCWHHLARLQALAWASRLGT